MYLRTPQGDPCMLLLKLGWREHMEALRKGVLFMKPLSFFTALEDDPARGDPYEGTDSILQPCDIGEFTIEPNLPGMEKFTVPLSDLAGPVRIALNRTAQCNLFCMFSVRKPVEGPIFPPPHQWFGDSFILFTNTPEFLSRVAKAATAQGLKIEGRSVEYYDATAYSGKTGRFRKQATYSHQSEYRIAVEPGVEEAGLLDVGDLSDITSEIIPIANADEVLKFSPEDARGAGLIWD
jgi:hypothetical protein